MATSLGFRLVVRTAADDADEIVITSVPTGDNPYLTAPPSVDGASADLLQGTTDVGSGTIKFWDEVTAVSTPIEGAGDTFEDYAAGAPLLATAGGPYTAHDTGGSLAGGWGAAPVTGATPNLSLASGAYRGHAINVAWGESAFPMDGRRHVLERAFSGLPAGTDVTVSIWCGPVAVFGARYASDQDPPGPYWEYGLEVDGTTTETALYPPTTEGAWRRLAVTVTVPPSGVVTVRFGVVSAMTPPFDHSAFLYQRVLYFDDLEIVEGGTTGGEARFYTATLHDVQDGVARLTQLSRACRIEQTTDGGETWAAFHRGYLNRLEVDGGEWTVTVGDTTRREQQTELFATLPTLDPADVGPSGLPMPMPRVGLILGGPIASDPTYGKFASIEDFGTTRWQVEETLLDAAGDDRLVSLKFVSGYLRPWYAKRRTTFEQDEWEKVNNAGRPYFVWDPEKYKSDGAHTVNAFGYFPDLLMRLDPVAAGDVVEKMPIARPVTHEPGDKTKPKAEYSALTGNDSIIYVDWGADATANPFPSAGTQYDVTLYSPAISQDNPLLIAGHPVDCVAYAASLSGIPWNEASRVATKAALGNALWYEGAEQPQKFADFQQKLGGWAGFLFRFNAETGEREFVATRVRPASAQFTITSADRLDATDGSGDGQPVIWAAEEDSVVNVVTFAQQRFRRYRYKEDEGEPPLHMMVTTDAVVEGARGDTTVNGDRTLRYELSGQMMVRAGDGSVTPLVLVTYDPDAPGYAEAAGGVVIDFAGWGIHESTVLVDAASSAASAQLGDEGVLDLPDLPVPVIGNSPVTQRGAGLRVVRIVKRDPLVGAVQFTVQHAGELSQTAVATPSGGSTDAGAPTLPTLSLAASADSPTTVVTVTLTNGAALAADNLRTELEYLTQTATPAADDEGTAFGPVTAYPDGDATAIDTPAVAPGSVVWVRARSVNPFSGVASAWTAWASVTLGTVQNGGGSAAESPYAPTLTLTAVADSTSGDVTATATASAAVVSVRFAVGALGGAPPTLADVRAASPDVAAPFVSGVLATLADGDVRTVGALAYDATGNESAMATDTVSRGLSGLDVSGADHGDLFWVDASGSEPVVVRLPIGLEGQVLYVVTDATGRRPTWGALSGGIVVRNILRSPDGSAILAPSGDPLITTT